MGQLVNRETVKISLSDGEWVEVKQYMGIGEQDRIDVLRDKYELGTAMAVIEVNVVNWSYKEKGEVVPITRENLGRMNPDIALELFLEISKLNQLTDSPKKAENSMPNSGPA